MRLNRDLRAEFVLLPSVALSIPWIGLSGVWGIWTLCTAEHRTLGDPRELRFLGAGEFAAVSVVALAFGVWLVFDGRRADASAPSVRRGQLAGVALALLGIALCELMYAYASGLLR